MTTTITQLFIGLETADGTEIKPQEVINRISREVEAGTFEETKGLWKGELEDSIKFECADIESNLKNHEDVTGLKKKLESVFNQESVMVKSYDAEVKF